MRKIADKEKRVGIWIRVSKLAHRQRAGEKTESPEHHRLRAVRFAEERGWKIVETYDLSNVSGKDVWHHPEAQRMVNDVRRGHITALLFSKLARLGRKTDALIRFQQIFSDYGADLIALDQPIDTTTADGRNYFRHKASDAEWEREQNSERMRESIEGRALAGKQISGSSPFGYRWQEGTLVPDPREAPIRRLIYELYERHKRKGTVARLLNEAGHRTRRGGLFTPLTVERLILDPTAKGLHRRNYTTRSADNRATLLKPESEWSWVRVEPVVPLTLWESCNALLLERKQPKRRPAKRAVQIFAGLVFCGNCGAKMYVPSNTPKYVCQKCRTKIARDVLETIFREQLKGFFLSPEAIERHLRDAEEKEAGKSDLLEQLVLEQQKVEREMNKTYRLYLEDAVSPEGFARLYGPLEMRFTQLQEEVPRLQAEVDFLRIQQVSKGPFTSEGISLFERWDALELAERRAIVETITQRIEVNGDEILIELCYLPPPVEELANCKQTPPARTACGHRRGSATWGTPGCRRSEAAGSHHSHSVSSHSLVLATSPSRRASSPHSAVRRNTSSHPSRGAEASFPVVAWPEGSLMLIT